MTTTSASPRTSCTTLPLGCLVLSIGLSLASCDGTGGTTRQSGGLTEFTIASGNGGPWDITQGPDGALWFTEMDANKIGRITTAGQVSEFSIPTADSHPWGIVTAGPDGNLWFTEPELGRVGKLAL